MVPDSHPSDPGDPRRKTVLPPPRKGPPPELSDTRPAEFPDNRPASGPDEDVDLRDEPVGADLLPAEPLPAFDPRARRSKVAIVIFSVIVPAAVLGLVVLLVNRLSEPRDELQTVAGGELHWFSDGLIAIQEDSDSGKRVYYLIKVPPSTDPRVRFGESSITLAVRSAEGVVDLTRPVDWDEAPYAMLIDYLDPSGETPKISCVPETIESYVETTGPAGSVAVLAGRLRQAETARP